MRCPKCQQDNVPEARACVQCGAPLPDPDHPEYAPTEVAPSLVRELIPGTTFARRYRVIEDLGKGGMGRVYKVLDTEVGEKLALKLLNPEIAADSQNIERFRNELKLARTVSHRNICRMYDLGREGDAYYITMEYVSGEDLKSLIHRIGALPLGKAVSIARQVCEGLAEAHSLGIVHRDLKPHNIMIDREGNARIMDFGIARSVKAKGITGAGMMIGTPEYMSPEQVDGKDADKRSDIYALGVVLFEMLTGRLPFEGDTPLSVAVKQKTEAPPDPRKLNPQVPEDLRHLVLKCLEKSREKRYADTSVLLSDLARIEKALPTTTQPLPIRRPTTSKQITVRLPSKKVWIPALVVLAAVLALAVWQFLPESQASKRSLAVIGFKNQTGDKAFDYLQEAIPNLLITSLEQSGRFRVTSWERLRDLLRQSGKDPSAALDAEAGFEVCRRDNIETVIVGSYIKAGETFATDVKVLDVATKQLLKSASSRGEGVASILKTQIDQLSRSVSRGISRSVLKLEKAPPKVMDMTTSSMEAYNAFLRGRDQYEKLYLSEARKSLEQAVALDPTFAAAYLWLGWTVNRLQDQKASEEAFRNAQRFAERATEKERLYIGSEYARAIEKNPDRQYRILLELTGKYPAEKGAHYLFGQYYGDRRRQQDALVEYERAIALDPAWGAVLNQAGYASAQIGNLDQAVRYFERYAAINPNDANPLDSIAEVYMLQGRLEAASAKYKEVLALKPDFFSSCWGLAYVAALREDYAEAEHWVDEFITRAPGLGIRLMARESKALLHHLLGRGDEALAEYAAIRQKAVEIGAENLAGITDWIVGSLHGDRGEVEAARRDYESFAGMIRKFSPDDAAYVSGVQSLLSGLVDLGQGRFPSARTRLKEVEDLLPRMDTGVREHMTFFAEMALAETALAQGKVDEAIFLAGKIKPQPFLSTNFPRIVIYNQPFVKDVLARAYWKKGDLEKASAEYRKLTTIDPANQIRYLISPLYHYRWGRVLEEKGDKVAARVQYQKFLDFWKDADASHPELADARRRLATLR